MKFSFILSILFPLSSSSYGTLTHLINGGASHLIIRGQLFCNNQPIGGKVILLEKDVITKEEKDEVDILVPNKTRTNPSFFSLQCPPISQFYIHGEESELDGAEWIMKIIPKCFGDSHCEKEFVIDWSERSMKGTQNYTMNKIDICDEEHRRKSSSDPFSYVSFSSGSDDDWENDRK